MGAAAVEACAAVLTAAGRGAIAVVRVWGRDAVAVADAAFRPARGPALARTPPGRLRLGRMGTGLGDEVVAVVLDGPVPEVEIQGHAGTAAVALVLDALRAAGATIASPEAWVAESAPSALAAEATADLARAATVRTAAILLEQADGALEREVRAILDDMEPARSLGRLDALLRRAAVGTRLVEGWRVALAGRPNVGKSRLLNALAGFDRAIVDPAPGTTRDVVTVRVALDGWPVELADTAGLRASDDPIEAEGMALAGAWFARSDLVLLVLDRSAPRSGEDRALLGAHPGALRVANKADLPEAWDAVEIGAPAVSAARGDGIEALAEAIARRLVPDPPPDGVGVPFRPSQVVLLESARRQLAAGRVEPSRSALHRLLGSTGEQNRGVRPKS